MSKKFTSTTVRRFFVYGTLKIGGVYAKDFDQVRQKSVNATLFGYQMHSCVAYPAITPICDGENEFTIEGEVHTFAYKHLDQVMRAMDRIEGYHPDDPESSLYKRELKLVVLESGEIVEAWVYVWTQSTEGLPEIKSGKWVNKRIAERV